MQTVTTVGLDIANSHCVDVADQVIIRRQLNGVTSSRLEGHD
jgi:hypothetical protein